MQTTGVGIKTSSWMTMLVMDIRKVGMGVCDDFMSMRMGVGFIAIPFKRMLMLMVFIVPVRMVRYVVWCLLWEDALKWRMSQTTNNPRPLPKYNKPANCRG